MRICAPGNTRHDQQLRLRTGRAHANSPQTRGRRYPRRCPEISVSESDPIYDPLYPPSPCTGWSSLAQDLPRRPANRRQRHPQCHAPQKRASGCLTMSTEQSDYGLSKQVRSAKIPAPDLPYLPCVPRGYRPGIGLVGAGGVTEYHLRAYRKLGLEVVVICDVDLERARKRRDQFYPDASICDDFHEVLRRNDVEVIDAALHPEHRIPLIE